jgi:hypothetical protein
MRNKFLAMIILASLQIIAASPAIMFVVWIWPSIRSSMLLLDYYTRDRIEMFMIIPLGLILGGGAIVWRMRSYSLTSILTRKVILVYLTSAAAIYVGALWMVKLWTDLMIYR